MIDFQLSTENLIRQDSISLVTRGMMNPRLAGQTIKVEYRLHRDEFPDPNNPLGNPLTIYCLHLPQINMTYTDNSEEHVFEALEEYFEEDMVRYYAEKLIEEREKDDDE